MAFTHGTAGATNRGSIFRGDVGFVSGTWLSTDVFTGTVVTGGGTVLAHEVTVGSAIVSTSVIGTSNPNAGSAVIMSLKNTSGGGSQSYGNIQVSSLLGTGTMAGDWWAVVTI